MDHRINLTRNGAVATIVLNRPAALNALEAEMRHRLTEILRQLDCDDQCRAVVLTGAGERAFTAGQDLGELAGFDSERAAEWIRELGALYQAIRDFGKPSIVAINGVASGAGLQIALHADVRIGHPGIRVSQPEINAGLPSVLGAWILRACVGLARARELGLSARLVDGEVCLRYGLVDMLVPSDVLVPDAERIARRLAEKPAVAVRLTKRHARDLTQASWDAAVASAEDLVRAAFATGEPQRAAAAFLARRATRSGA